MTTVDLADSGCCSVVAAAGCGKTETIAKSVHACDDRQLVLTHTNAGVEAVKRRMRRLGISDSSASVDTIAGWCLKYVLAYPSLAKWNGQQDSESNDWYDQLYPAMIRLLDTRVARAILRASYAGVFVDEYQDCTKVQHALATHLAGILPTCVVGDPLQAVFRFRGDPPKWVEEVEAVFPRMCELTTPYRWIRPGHDRSLGEWLAAARVALEAGRSLVVDSAPVHHVATPSFDNWRDQAREVAFEVCKREGTVAAIAKWPGDTHDLARMTGGRFQCVEPLSAKHGADFIAELGAVHDVDRPTLLIEFLGKLATGVRRIASEIGAARSLTKYRGPGSRALNALASGGSPKDAAVAMRELTTSDGVRVYRRELLWSVLDTLEDAESAGFNMLPSLFRKRRNLTSHVGRRLARCSVGSTLLLKGMEFHHAIVINTGQFTLNDFYVAITRGSRSLTVLTPEAAVDPAQFRRS